jgi:hypothetical protein
MNTMDRMKMGIAALVVLSIGVASASAALTTVYQTTWGGEENLIDGLVANPGAPSPGGSPTGFDDLLSSADWTRVDDSIDQLWYDTNGGVSVEAIYTSSSLTFGFLVNPDLGGAAPALDTGNWVTAPAGGTLNAVGETATFDVDNSLPLVFGVTTGSSTFYSYEGFNGGMDRMVTFYNASTDQWAFGFEDGTDSDYQDFVFILDEIKPVPVPGAALLGVLGLAATSWVKRRFA